MSGDERKKSAHCQEVPQPRIVKATHQRTEPGKLYRIKDNQSAENGHDTENRAGISQLLQRIILLRERRFLPEEEIVLRHGPDARDITRNEEQRAEASGEYLINHVKNSGDYERPYEEKMPIPRTRQPSTKSQSAKPSADAGGRKLRRIGNEIMLRNFCGKAGKRREYLDAAQDHHGERNCIHPMSDAYDQRMFIDRDRLAAEEAA